MSDECDRVYGESWSFQPMKSVGGGRPAADSSRPALTGITGIYEAETFESTEFGSEARGSLPASMTKPRLSVDKRRFAAHPLPQRFDRVTRADTGDVFEISQREADQDGRVVFHLKRIIGG